MRSKRDRRQTPKGTSLALGSQSSIDIIGYSEQNNVARTGIDMLPQSGIRKILRDIVSASVIGGFYRSCSKCKKYKCV